MKGSYSSTPPYDLLAWWDNSVFVVIIIIIIVVINSDIIPLETAETDNQVFTSELQNDYRSGSVFSLPFKDSRRVGLHWALNHKNSCRS
jgi:hypothetical protein